MNFIQSGIWTLKSIRTLAAGLILLVGLSQAHAVAPSQPGDISYSVYSGTAAEVFWSRSTDVDDVVVGYEIAVNGQVMVTVDALSYFTTSLIAGSLYEISVTAVDGGDERSIPAVISFIGGDRSTPVTDALPMPTNLYASVYSYKAAELFWDRSTIIGLTYDITRNGEFIASTDGTSYYDRMLIAGTSYNYDVVAVDQAGNRSPSAQVSITSNGESPPVTSDGVPTPTGLQASVYSTTSAELFWDRSTTVGLDYEIKRDDELIASTDGTSYYDRMLIAGTSYNYDVVAVDQAGNRSPSAQVSITSSGESPPVTSDGVPTPTGVQASVYSSTAAELFWDRTTTQVLSYEILQDGVAVSTTNGTSHFIDDLLAGSTNSFQIVAINVQGERSDASGVMFTTSGGSAPNVTPTTNPLISEPADFYRQDGYGTLNVLRVDIRTETIPGVCTEDDQSGCTLDDVKADIDGDDDFTVDIPVHFQAADFPDDGSISNAELRQRGGFSRLAAQKSFRIKLDSKENLWRNERRLQLNKMPYDTSRIRNKLAFDLMSELSNLPSLRTQFVNLWIDDGAGPEDYGLFTHTEYVGKEYLVNRDRDADDNVYKIGEFTFSSNDLTNMVVDEDGEAVDEDRFALSLDIKRGDDHRKVIEMINAVNDQSRTFESVLDQYFDADNVLTWVAVNFLLHQVDAVTHNFYLYNPIGTEKFFFLPWDYDGAFGVEQEPVNSYETSELLRRLYYGYGKGRASNFLNRYYRMSGIHQQVLDKAAELRNSQLINSNIQERANSYAAVVSPFAGASPDVDNNMSYDELNSRQFSDYVTQSHLALQNYGIPLPPKHRTPQIDANGIAFRWYEAHDMNAAELSYDLEISSSPSFDEADANILRFSGIGAESHDGYFIPFNQIASGTQYVRLTARVTSDPDRLWQTASNRPTIDGEMRVGVQEFTVP